MSYPEIPHTYVDLERIFGAFSYTEIAGSADITVDPKWIRTNIVGVELEGYHKTIWLHKLLQSALQDAWNGAITACPDYAVCRVASLSTRHKLHNVNKPLSMHSWGIAIDINPATNAYGTQGDIPAEFVQAFKDVGFSWGGDWKTPDPMHFQYASGKGL